MILALDSPNNFSCNFSIYSVLLVGDSYALSWKKAFNKVHKKCNISASYLTVGHPGSLYFPVDSQRFRGPAKRTQTRPNGPAAQMMETITKLKPNITLLFSKSIHVCELSLNQSVPRVNALNNLEKWKDLIRTAVPQFIETVLPYTTPGISSPVETDFLLWLFRAFYIQYI